MATVLVIDNSAEDRAEVRKILEPRGHKILEAEAVTPEMDGLASADLLVVDPCTADAAEESVVKQIKAQYPRLPVIVVSMKGNEELVIRALQNGAVSYVPKRLLSSELLRTVRDVLDVAREHDSQSRLLERREEMTTCFVLENDRQMLSSVVAHLQQCCAEFGLFADNTELTRVGMALDEALSNAMMHGNLEVSSALRDQEGNDYEETARQRASEEKFRDRRIYVTAKFDRQAAEFVIRDEGPGFDPEQLLDPTDTSNLERVSGRGVLLIRTFMDDVKYNNKGNCVTLRKRRVESAV